MKLLLLAIFAYWLYVQFTPEKWTAFVYPDAPDLSKVIESGPFETLEECRDIAKTELIAEQALDNGDYECGLNCGLNADLGIQVCEKTKR